MRIAIVTDAWFPHVSGVATTIKATKDELEKMGHSVLVIGPSDFKYTMPMPTYPEIRLALFPDKKLTEILDEFKPDAVHLSVEGPLGMAGRGYCKKRGMNFTTTYHTQFPEYVNVRTGIPVSWTYAFARWFHGGGSCTNVATPALMETLKKRGFKNLAIWNRGVDTAIFNTEDPLSLPGEKPIFMYMGRVAIEKNIEAFLKLDLPGTKYIVGDGPDRARLEKKFPETKFTGYKFGRELARHVAAADAFVFPSLTDTLGLVMLEANACGVPVAALPSEATQSVIKEGVNGVVSENLKDACMRALTLSRGKVREYALEFGWRKPTELFFKNLQTSLRQ
jgi:glycosyltransferase involved in cell wall biosynthesis